MTATRTRKQQTAWTLDAWREDVLSSVIEPVLPPSERASTRPRVVQADLRITNKAGQLVPLVLNQEQRRYCETVGLDPDDPHLDQLGPGEKLREIILKGRQQGFSTLVLSLVFKDTCNHPNRRSIFAAHSMQSTSNVFEMVERFHQHLPPEKQHPLKGDKSKELHFADTDSKIEIGTAGTPDLGSGSTYHNIVKSERAKWIFADPRKLRELDASLDAAGKEGNIWQESTAKGRNHYETDYNKALNHESNYRAHFFPWFEHDAYKLPVPPDVEFTLDERARMRDYNLTQEQMYWYRIEAVGEFGDLAAQEYPFNAEEAFVSSAHGYFNSKALLRLNDRLKSRDYDPIDDMQFHPVSFPLLDTAYGRGELEVWEEVQDSRGYIISADCAWCESEDSDLDSADVWDTRTFAQVAHLHGRWLPEHYAEILYELGLYYNAALLAVEWNPQGGGENVLRRLRDLNYPEQKGRASSGLYLHDPTLITETRRPRSDTLKAGWPTNEQTKAFATGKLNHALIEDYIEIRSRKTVREMFTFVRKPGGELAGEGTAKDDCVMSASIGTALLSLKFDQQKTGERENINPVPSRAVGTGRMQRTR